MYQWDFSLETGDEKIDSQHRQLIDTINQMTEAHKQGKGKDEIEKTLDFLTGYTILHFSNEEKMMMESKYPDYAQHKRFHEEFKETVGNFTQRLANESITDDLVNSVVFTMGDWLFRHIKGEDFRMAAYVKTYKSE